MDKKIYYNDLFSIYENLFTSIQKEYFKAYYISDLSFSEIADNYNISRNAVFKSISNVVKKLDYYEEVLKIFSKFKKITEKVNELNCCKLKEEIETIINE